MLVKLAITVLFLLIPAASLRLLYILPNSHLGRRKNPTRDRETPAHLLIVLGSGGHTAEMLSLIRDLNTSRYNQRTYVVSSGDSFSADHARSFEQNLLGSKEPTASEYGTFAVVTVPRARKIHQSILTAPFSSLLCLFACLKLLAFGVPTSPPLTTSTPSTKSARSGPQMLQPRCSSRPDLILTNGPATGVIVVLASLILRFFSFGADWQSPSPSGNMRTIYVESWARVTRLSLSGKVLLRVVDRFLVQWERLATETNGRAEYLGVLVE